MTFVAISTNGPNIFCFSGASFHVSAHLIGDIQKHIYLKNSRKKHKSLAFHFCNYLHELSQFLQIHWSQETWDTKLKNMLPTSAVTCHCKLTSNIAHVDRPSTDICRLSKVT